MKTTLAAALTGTTGAVLLASTREGETTTSFGEFHRLADLFYPGIMTLGLAALADDIKGKILAQHPSLPTAAVGVVDGETARTFLAEQEAIFGAELEFTADATDIDPLKSELDYIHMVRG